MPTLTIRNVPVKVVQSLKARARRNKVSMEQEVRNLLQEQVVDRQTALAEIVASWSKQTRRPKAAEIDSWIDAGRP